MRDKLNGQKIYCMLNDQGPKAFPMLRCQHPFAGTFKIVDPRTNQGIYIRLLALFVVKIPDSSPPELLGVPYSKSVRNNDATMTDFGKNFHAAFTWLALPLVHGQLQTLVGLCSYGN